MDLMCKIEGGPKTGSRSNTGNNEIFEIDKKNG